MADSEHYPAERIGRIMVGLAAVIAGTILLTSAGPVLAVALEALLVGAGLDLAITGAPQVQAGADRDLQYVAG